MWPGHPYCFVIPFATSGMSPASTLASFRWQDTEAYAPNIVRFACAAPGMSRRKYVRPHEYAAWRLEPVTAMRIMPTNHPYGT